MKRNIVLLLIFALWYFNADAQDSSAVKTDQMTSAIHCGFHGTRQYALPIGATVLDAIAAIDEKTKNELSLVHVWLIRKSADGLPSSRIKINVDEQRQDPSKSTVLQNGDIVDIRANSLSPIL